MAKLYLREEIGMLTYMKVGERLEVTVNSVLSLGKLKDLNVEKEDKLSTLYYGFIKLIDRYTYFVKSFFDL